MTHNKYTMQCLNMQGPRDTYYQNLDNPEFERYTVYPIKYETGLDLLPFVVIS